MCLCSSLARSSAACSGSTGRKAEVSWDKDTAPLSPAKRYGSVSAPEGVGKGPSTARISSCCTAWLMSCRPTSGKCSRHMTLYKPVKRAESAVCHLEGSLLKAEQLGRRCRHWSNLGMISAAACVKGVVGCVLLMHVRVQLYNFWYAVMVSAARSNLAMIFICNLDEGFWGAWCWVRLNNISNAIDGFSRIKQPRGISFATRIQG